MKQQRGFTLIELLVVISIISVLSTVVFASLQSAKKKSQDVQVRLQVRQIINALYLARDDSTGNFPGGTPGIPICLGLPTAGSCASGAWHGNDAITAAVTAYISKVPIPPSPPYIYPGTVLGGAYLYYPNIATAGGFGGVGGAGTYLVWAQSVPITSCTGGLGWGSYYKGLEVDGYYYCYQNITTNP